MTDNPTSLPAAAPLNAAGAATRTPFKGGAGGLAEPANQAVERKLTKRIRKPKVVAKIDPLQVADTVAAALAGISRATWWRLHAAAKTPAAVKLGRKVLWNKAEVVAWIEARCPDRRTWEAMKAAGRRLKVS